MNTFILNSVGKLIPQSYDDINVMSGAIGEVKANLRNKYKYVHFMLSYAHTLNIIIQNTISQNTINPLIYFQVLLTDLTKHKLKICIRLQLHAKSIIFVQPTPFFENRDDLIESFQELKEKCNKTRRQAYVCKELSKIKILYLVCTCYTKSFHMLIYYIINF